jgi:hypothetical protein
MEYCPDQLDYGVRIVKHTTLRYKLTIFLFILLCIIFSLSSHALSQEKRGSAPASASNKATLVEAAMCEGIKELTPKNQAIVFSITIGRVSCFTSFDPVPEETFIYHNWFRRDKLSTRIKLSLQPPRWSTFSSIQLREADQGPWRVEVTDEDGRILHLLRFSITD